MGLKSIVLPLWLRFPISETGMKVPTPITVVSIEERTRDPGSRAGSVTNVTLRESVTSLCLVEIRGWNHLEGYLPQH